MGRNRVQVVVEYEGDFGIIDDVLAAVVAAVEDVDWGATSVFADVADKEEIE